MLASAPQDDLPAVLGAARADGAAERALAAARADWDETLGCLQVDTPDKALNLMVNHWLPYQAIACRIRRARRSTKPRAPMGSATSCRTPAR